MQKNVFDRLREAEDAYDRAVNVDKLRPKSEWYWSPPDGLSYKLHALAPSDTKEKWCEWYLSTGERGEDRLGGDSLARLDCERELWYCRAKLEIYPELRRDE